jgi:lipoic acid synthetase
LGNVCTRRCHYCSVETGRPGAVDEDEPRRIAEAVQALRLRHAVITSVNRDELPDGGAAIFAETIRYTRQVNPDCTIEVLIPDLEGNAAALDLICQARPNVLNHNIETVPRLFPTLRPQGKYQRSLDVLAHAKRASLTTKSGLIIGMGETPEEIRLVLHDLRQAGCDVLTIGQYLPPTARHLPVAHFYEPAAFTAFKTEALAMGFVHVESGPLVRSSYHADQHASR